MCMSLATALSSPVVQVIHNFWQPISDHYLWDCGIRSWAFYTVMATVHLLCWLSISCSVYVMDYLELIGVKQVCVLDIGEKNTVDKRLQ